MNNSFPRIITLLRKERGISQKAAAQELAVSQSLLSHYEKGIRECGLEFIVKVADFYGVSCDYLLGRSPERTGTFIKVDDIPEPDATGKENTFKGSILPTLNKKLLFNSLNVIYDKLQRCNNKSLTTEVSYFLMLSVYRILRVLYGANPSNPKSTFAVPPLLARGSAAANMELAEANAHSLCKGVDVGEMQALDNTDELLLSPEQISKEYPLFSSSMLNLVQNCETRMGYKQK